MDFGIFKLNTTLKLARICVREISLSHMKPMKVTGAKLSSSKCNRPAPPPLEVCTISDTVIDPNHPEPAVIIIGAGLAGLSAAHRLNQCGITNFTILEATDRPGGRIHSCWLGDVIAEMGAHHILGGCSANPIYNLACQEGLLTPPLMRQESGKPLFCTSEGRAVALPVAHNAYHIYKQIEHEAKNLFAGGVGKDHGSLMNFFCLRIQQELQHFPDDQRYDASRVMYGLTNCLRAQLGEDLSKISADHFGSFIPIPGGKVRVPLGFVGVLAPLLRDLPDCSLKYLKPVSTIRWDTAKGAHTRAKVICCDRDEFCADYVIVTVSLGVLKMHHDKLFCPVLPQEKVTAINNLGYGHVNKIYLDYPRPFWVWREGGINFAWSAQELSHRTDWTRGLSVVEEVEGSRHILCAYVSGPEAIEMERATDEEVAEGITRVLRTFTGDGSLPFPSSILRSKWTSDPFFCGAFSFLGVNSSVGLQCDLSTPIPIVCGDTAPVLFFAGEATCPGHYSTTHGARISGVREAERIIQLTKKFRGPPPM